MNILELFKDIYRTEKAKKDELRNLYVYPTTVNVLGTKLRKEERNV